MNNIARTSEIKAAGKIKAQVYVKRNGKIVPKENGEMEFTNIITDLGLAALKPSKTEILELKPLGSFINIGVGSKDELTTVTDLQDLKLSKAGSLSTIRTVRGTTADPKVVVREYQVSTMFDPSGEDRNYKEIGLSASANGGTLHTYAVFRDEEFAISDITVLADEYLNITYTYQVQGTMLDCFYYSSHSNHINGAYVLADRDEVKLLGPFSLSGDSSLNTEVPSEINAYAILSPGAGYNPPSGTTSRAAIWYFLDSETNEMNLWKTSLKDTIFTVGDMPNITSSGALLSSIGELVKITSAFDVSFRPKYKFSAKSLGGATFPFIPGELTNDEPIHVVGFGNSVTGGGAIFFDTPIKITKDMRFDVANNLASLWSVKDPINTAFIDLDA